MLARRAHHDVRHEPEISADRAARHTVHRLAADGLWPRRAPPVAPRPGYAGRCVGLRRGQKLSQPSARCRPSRTRTLLPRAMRQPSTSPSKRLGTVSGRALASPRSSYSSSSRASSACCGTALPPVVGREISGGRLGQFVLYALFAGGALGRARRRCGARCNRRQALPSGSPSCWPR